MDTEITKIIRKTEYAGIGALVQFVGVACWVGITYYGYKDVSGPDGRNAQIAKYSKEMQEKIGHDLLIWFGIGFAVFAVLTVIGASLSQHWICGKCRNKISSKDVKLCPTCNTPLER